MKNSHISKCIVLALLFSLSAVVVMAQQNVGIRHLKVGVLLPLKDTSPRGQKMVEFYQGMLLAVDSMRSRGVDIDVVALHSGTTETEMASLLSANNLSDRDVIFGPLDGSQLPLLSDYCQRNNVRLVVPFSPNIALLNGNPLQYVVTAPRVQMQAQAASIINVQFANSHYVFVNAQDNNEEGGSFENQLRGLLSQRGAFMRNVEVDASDDQYALAFNPLRHNVVVVNSSSIRAVNTMVPHLLNYMSSHPECEFSVIGYPSWQTFTNTHLSNFYKLDTYIYTSFYRHPLAESTAAFDQTFQYWFHQPMANTFPRWGMMGFDVAWFFMHGLELFGDSLESMIGSVPTFPFQTPLLMARTDAESGFLNIFVELVHYTKQQSIEVLVP
ncbi:MAG: hypothetical protein J5486_09190 [Bacteroidaceae bacterium]|nr:hypothetical protein [Bacteroidaceae bacterium]